MYDALCSEAWAAGACRVCVVYGALPPEMRRTQARLFNDPGSGYDVLVASDAVGMGLNLNIRRIIFHTMEKTDGSFARVPISISQIKQIAGACAHGSPPQLICTESGCCLTLCIIGEWKMCCMLSFMLG